MSTSHDQPPELPNWLAAESLRAQLSTLYEQLSLGTLDGLLFALLLSLRTSTALPHAVQIAPVGLGLPPFQATPPLNRVRDVARVGYRLALTPGDRTVPAFEAAVLQEISRAPCPPAVSLLDDDRLILGVAAGVGAVGAGTRAAFIEFLRPRGAPSTLYRSVLEDLARSLAAGPLTAWSAEHAFPEQLPGLDPEAWRGGAEVSVGDRIAAFWVRASAARERLADGRDSNLSRDPQLTRLRAHFLAARDDVDGLGPLDSSLLLHALLISWEGAERAPGTTAVSESASPMRVDSAVMGGTSAAAQGFFLPPTTQIGMTVEARDGGIRLEPERSVGQSRGPSLATLGIVTALPKECAAMRLMLEHESRWKAPGEGGGRDYYLGEVPAEGGGVHRVAVALLPDMGNNSAAITGTLFLQHFPSVRHIIMCGIGGGVPRPGEVEHDVRLGDVVVSNRNGVVQYDLIKELPDGTREYRHPPRPPSAELLGAVRHLLTEEVMGRHPWEEFLARGEQMRHGVRPASDLDARGVLLEYPADRERRAGQPRVFHGAIAAANVLLKNPEHRDYLGRSFGVKAIEMEGSGVADATWMDAAGYLVVRGICDYCDGNKGDVWQGAAAVAAAAYVRALVGSMPLDASSIG